MMSECWVNGVRTQQSSVYDRGLQFGDGLFETLVFKSRTPLLLKEHLDRLCRDSLRLNIQVCRTTIENDVNRGLQQSTRVDGTLKIIVTRGNSPRGYSYTDNIEANRYLYISPYSPPNSQLQQGICLTLCKTQLAQQPLLAGIKHLNRLEQILARQEITEGFNEGVICDTQGQVIEGCMSNIFIISNNELVTPILDQCGVTGVMAQQVMLEAKKINIVVQQQRLSVNDLINAESIFLTNSINGIWPVTHFLDKKYCISNLVKKLQASIKRFY
jgi:4-amino-4-deoxychorismate lyase